MKKLKPLGLVQVRGDHSELWLYEREESLPDNFQEFLAPYRSLRDFKLRHLPGGANLTARFTREFLRREGLLFSGDPAELQVQHEVEILHNDSLEMGQRFVLEAILKNEEWIVIGTSGHSALFEVNRIIFSYSRTGWMKVDLRCDRSGKIRSLLKAMNVLESKSTRFARELALAVQASELHIRTEAARSEPRRFDAALKLNLASRYSETRPCSQASKLRNWLNGGEDDKLDLVRDTPLFLVELINPSREYGEVDAEILVNGKHHCNCLLDCHLLVRSLICDRSTRNLIWKAGNRQSMELEKRLTAVKDLPVVVRSYAPIYKPAGSTNRVSRPAFWEVKKFGREHAEDKQKVFRLFDAQGYFDTNLPGGEQGKHAPMIPDCVYRYERESARIDLGNLYHCMTFVDLGFGYSKAANYVDWSQDLVDLCQTPEKSRILIGVIGRRLPRLSEEDASFRNLFLFHLYCKLRRPLELDLPEGDLKAIQKFAKDQLQSRPGPKAKITWGDGDELEMVWSIGQGRWACVKSQIGDTEARLSCYSRHPEEDPPSDTEVFTENFSIVLQPTDIQKRQEHLERPGLWEYLYTFFRERALLVLSLQTLRSHGIRISHRLSWEKTAQDCIEALELSPLRKLARFGHLVLRVGITGAVHVYRNRVAMDQGRQLYFDPVGSEGRAGAESDAFFRDVSDMGSVLGSNSIFAGSILAAFLKNIEEADEGQRSTNMVNSGASELVGKGIRQAIRASQAVYLAGYGSPSGNGSPGTWGFDIEPRQPCDGATEPGGLRDLVSLNLPPLEELLATTENKPIGCTNIHRNQRWTILEESANTGLYPLACKIVVHGLEKAVNLTSGQDPTIEVVENQATHHRWPAVHVPVVKFGQFVSLEREEIEGLRNIDSIIRTYRNDRKKTKPLSFAVFGPPGSGKSFGVEQVARSIFRDKVEFITCNLAQLSTPEDLGAFLLRTRDAHKADVIPVLFVDEFDCSLGETPLAWLRYFLALIEDGEFKQGNETLHLQRTIIVFAGGTFQSFGDFAAQSTASSEEERMRFVRAKGPDFVSRLAGHINTIGINPRNEYDTGFVIRRAIQLRSQLERRNLIGSTKTAMAAPAFIEALLRIPEYKHGSRSLRIVLDMSMGRDGMVRLPSLSQLEMHVGSEQLMELYENALKKPTIVRTEQSGLIVDPGRM